MLGYLVLIYNYDVLLGGLFILAGRMIFYVILNDCSCVLGVFLVVVLYISIGIRDLVVEYIILEDILDLDLNEKFI